MDRRQIQGTQNELDQINLNLKMRWNVVLIISLGTLILFFSPYGIMLRF